MDTCTYPAKSGNHGQPPPAALSPPGREAHGAGELTTAQLREVEDRAIAELLEIQEQDRDGKERVAEGQVLSDADLWKMDWYVPGVITQ